MFNRDVQYLAIGIIDRFLICLSKSRVKIDQSKEIGYYSLAALIIAVKFLKNDKSELRKILAGL